MKNQSIVLRIACAAFIALACVGLTGDLHAEEPATRVMVNGQLYAVHFNDGDSFRVLEGGKQGVKARLIGFNTLETHGPVHMWGTWKAKELYTLAKMATLHSRRGTWSCETSWDLDTYGRTLMRCPGLAEELVRLGLAHAMSVTDEPAEPAYLAAQKEAIAAKRGIWAHGVPEFILTSLHSVEEDVDGKGTYNRLVSTRDGHSVKWRHETQYEECQRVCQMVYPEPDATAIASLTQALRADAAAATAIAGLGDDGLAAVLRDYGKYRHVNRKIAKDNRPALGAVLGGWAAQGKFGAAPGSEGSCMLHIDFKRRYGNRKASCLK